MKKIILVSIICIVTITILSITAFSIYFFAITSDIELDLSKLEKSKTSVFLDINNDVINEENYVKYEDIPKNLINAFISIEDKRYFKHHGIDIKRMFGAAFYNLKHKNHAQGASTITQQLIKNTHLDSKKTITRKLKEIKLALALERNLSKEQILEKYLNSLYFGNGIYGIKDASEKIFNKSLNELNLSEMATMAGIIKAPLYYSPLNNIKKSQDRRNIVLKTMLDNDFILESEYNNTKQQPITINKCIFHNNLYEYYTKQALFEASSLLNITTKELINGNYKIYTYYDKTMQNDLINTISDNQNLINNHNCISMISDNKTYGINAIYTNIDSDIFKFRRQVGSTIKPIAVYLPALNEGLIAPVTIYNDEKISFNGYNPSNYNDYYRGYISIREAIMHSSNIVAVDVLNKLSIEKSKQYLNKMNIKIDDEGLSIALGGIKNGLSPIELSSAYCCIANGGKYSNNTFIREIRDNNGNILYKLNPKHTKVFEESASYLMTDMLASTAQSGTSRKLSVLPYQIASKTGTVASPNDKNNNIDAYNMSYTTQNTMLVWIGGNLDKNIQGGSNPTIIAREIYRNIYKNSIIKPFEMPISVKRVSFDRDSYINNHEILLSNENNTLNELFDVKYLPKDSIITPKNITLDTSNDTISLNNVKNTTMKIYKNNFIIKNTLINEIICNENNVKLPIKPNIFNKYTIEIYYRDKLIKTIII